METKKAIESLTKAKELLITDGWCRGSYHDSQGRHCAWGAVREVDWLHQDELADLLKQNIITPKDEGWRRWGLTEWNDCETRSKRDVIRLFDRTIKNLADSGTQYIQLSDYGVFS